MPGSGGDGRRGAKEFAELLIVVGHAAVADEDALDERWADALARGEDVAVEVPGVGHALEGGRHRGVRRVGERAGRVDVETGVRARDARVVLGVAGAQNRGRGGIVVRRAAKAVGGGAGAPSTPA